MPEMIFITVLRLCVGDGNKLFFETGLDSSQRFQIVGTVQKVFVLHFFCEWKNGKEEAG